MILGTKSRYAVMAMVDLAINSCGKPLKLVEIAERQEIPLSYLEQIFSRLKNNGIINSIKGPGGGYLIEKDIGKLTIAEIIVAAEEQIKMTRCGEAGKGGCMATKAQCLTHDLWEGLGDKIDDYFRSITLADICSKKT